MMLAGLDYIQSAKVMLIAIKRGCAPMLPTGYELLYDKAEAYAIVDSL